MGIVVTAVLFVISAIVWAASAATENSGRIWAAFFTLTFLALAALQLLWRSYNNRRSGADVRPYRLGAVMTVVITVPAFLIYGGIAGAASDSAETTFDTARVTLHGTLSGDEEFGGDWTVLPTVIIESTTIYTNVIVDMAPDSSSPSFVITITTSEGDRVECRSEKRINWERLNYRLRFSAGCDDRVALEDIRDVEIGLPG